MSEFEANLRVRGDSAWRDVAVTDCRLGAVTAYGTHLTRVRITGGKLDYVNLRDGVLSDVVLEDCVIGELDLIGADYSALRGLANLRGATISSDQLTDLAPHLAAHLGLTVRD